MNDSNRNRKKHLLIYGAGAIGRGFVPWVFNPSEFLYSYVETNPKIRDLLNTQKNFSSYRTVQSDYQRLDVTCEHCYNFGEEKPHLSKFDAVITAIGPRQLHSLKDPLSKTKLRVICFENDSESAIRLSSLTENQNIVFGVPDVITSNTAPKHLLEKDPLSLITEDGICFAEQEAASLGGNCKYVSREELQKQWLAKLYIHNTPHCIAAYLGAFRKVNFLHEAMETREVYRIVSTAMKEMQTMLCQKYQLEPEFVQWYADKELARFANPLLFDPISRVAREPFRKLGFRDRLIGAAEACLTSGMIPKSLLLGIMAAFCYENSHDPDFHIMHLVRALKPYDFLSIIIRLRPEEPLFDLLLEHWNQNLEILRGLQP